MVPAQLRCSHGDHRDVRGRLRAAPSTDHQAARDQDRQVMRDFWLHSVKGSIMRFVYKPRE